MEKIILKISGGPDRRELGEVSLSRDLEISATAKNPRDTELLNLEIKDVFKDGVRKFGHIPEIGGKHTWIAEKIDPESPDFFETAIEMLEEADFSVKFLENAKRTEKLSELGYYLENSGTEEGYKRLIESRKMRLTDRQISDILKSFAEEFTALGKKLYAKK